MIIALEGPSRSGKSTIFRYLQSTFAGVHYIGRVPTPKQLLPYMEYVEVIQEGLFRELYQADKVYVTDRNFCVSSMVYAQLNSRPSLIDVKPWLSHLRVIYLDVSVGMLQLRNNESTQPDLQVDFVRLKQIYEDVLPTFHHVRVNGDARVSEIADQVSKAIKIFCKNI